MLVFWSLFKVIQESIKWCYIKQTEGNGVTKRDSEKIPLMHIRVANSHASNMWHVFTFSLTLSRCPDNSHAKLRNPRFYCLISIKGTWSVQFVTNKNSIFMFTLPKVVDGTKRTVPYSPVFTLPICWGIQHSETILKDGFKTKWTADWLIIAMESVLCCGVFQLF